MRSDARRGRRWCERISAGSGEPNHLRHAQPIGGLRYSSSDRSAGLEDPGSATVEAISDPFELGLAGSSKPVKPTAALSDSSARGGEMKRKHDWHTTEVQVQATK